MDAHRHIRVEEKQSAQMNWRFTALKRVKINRAAWPRGFGAMNGFQLNALISQRPVGCLVFVLMTQPDFCCCGGALRDYLVAS